MSISSVTCSNYANAALTEQEATDFAEEYTTGEAFGVGVGTVVIGRTSGGVFWGIAAGTSSTAEQYADALGGTIYKADRLHAERDDDRS